MLFCLTVFHITLRGGTRDHERGKRVPKNCDWRQSCKQWKNTIPKPPQVLGSLSWLQTMTKAKLGCEHCAGLAEPSLQRSQAAQGRRGKKRGTLPPAHSSTGPQHTCRAPWAAKGWHPAALLVTEADDK